jgi:hypothetical protein
MPTDFEKYYELTRQQTSHLDRRFEDFDKRLDSLSMQMTNLQKELKDFELTFEEIKFKATKLNVVEKTEQRITEIENIQKYCPGRRLLTWGSVCSLITIIGLCAGVYFQYRRVHLMMEDTSTRIERLVEKKMSEALNKE